MMKRTVILFFLPFLFGKSVGQTPFPDIIPVTNIQKAERLKGTRIFLTIPSNYKVLHRATSYGEFQKDSITGFQIIENVNDNFFRLKNEILKHPKGLNDLDTGFSMAVKVDSFNGVYYSGPFKEKKSVILIFGDSSFAVTIIGVFQYKDQVAETDLNNILKTTHYDKSINPDPLELKNYKFDINITGFKYVPLIGMNSLTYSIDGTLKSIEDERHKSSFELESYKSPSIKNAENIFKQKMEELTEFGISKVSNLHHRTIDIHGYPAFETTMDEKGEYIADTKFYTVIIQKENQALLFWGVDRDNGKWLEKFKSTVQSIKFD